MKYEKNAAASTPEMVTISRVEYEELKLQNQWLLEQLGLAKKRQFGASSEQLQEGLMDQLSLMANEASAKTAPKSALGKALHDLREQWSYLVRYLEDGRLELSNNRAERSIEPFVMGWKNWLFSNTSAGAQSSAVIYSLIETVKENNDLAPYRYLVWLLNNTPGLSRTDDAWAESFLPVNAPQKCKIPKP